MKELVLGVFAMRADAEKAINRLHRDVGVETDDLSYVYRTSNGEVTEIDASEIASGTPAEGAATGAMTGGAIGAIAGLATAAGAIPVIGPIFAAGPLVTALGLGAGALGTTAAGAVTGAAAGGLVGALVNWGMSEENAQTYADRVQEGDILVAAHTMNPSETVRVFEETGATEVNAYAPAV